jgi:hypothetical protein
MLAVELFCVERLHRLPSEVNVYAHEVRRSMVACEIMNEEIEARLKE